MAAKTCSRTSPSKRLNKTAIPMTPADFKTEPEDFFASMIVTLIR